MQATGVKQASNRIEFDSEGGINAFRYDLASERVAGLTIPMQRFAKCVLGAKPGGVTRTTHHETSRSQASCGRSSMLIPSSSGSPFSLFDPEPAIAELSTLPT